MGDFRRTLAAVLGKEEEDEKIALLCSKVDHLDNRKCFRMVSRHHRNSSPPPPEVVVNQPHAISQYISMKISPK